MSSRIEQTQVGFAALLARVARDWRRAVDRRLQPYGLTEATWLPLLHLARAPAPMRQNELAASLSLDGSSVVRLIDALQAAGLVDRREDRSDRRANAIVLTAQGLETVTKVEAVSRQVRDEALRDLADVDLSAATRVLHHVGERLARLPDAART